MISGRQALSTIEQAIAQLRGNEDQLDASMRSAADEAARLRADRTGLLRSLAQVKLDAMMRDQVVGALDAAERRALDLMASRRQTLDRLTQRRTEALAAFELRQTARHAAAAAFEEALAAHATYQKEHLAELRRSTAWMDAKAAADAAAGIADASETKAAQAETDRAEKGKPYEDDPLFMYLWERKFGTSSYASSYFVKFFDRMVARLVGYPDAKANYTMLNEIPARLREHAERRKADIVEASDALARVEREQLDRMGAGPLSETVRSARTALETAERDLIAARATLQAVETEKASQGGTEGPLYEQAIDAMAQADARDDIRTLYREAARTKTRDDEAIVAKIEQIDIAIAAAEAEAKRARSQATELATRRLEVEREREQFRQQGYDNPYAGFKNEGILGQVLRSVLEGAVKGIVLRGVLKDNYAPRRDDSGPWGGGSGGGGFGGGGFSGGFGGGSSGGGWPGGFPFPDGGGGDSGGSSGSGGGGFRTGGSF